MMVAAGLLLMAGCGDGAMAFDSAKWAAERGNYDGESARTTMVAAARDAGLRPGASRAAVRGLLGEPDSTGPAADIYFLGRSRSGPSFETLRIDYDAGGRVSAAAIRRT